MKELWAFEEIGLPFVLNGTGAVKIAENQVTHQNGTA
jgi:hypothetical protein